MHIQKQSQKKVFIGMVIIPFLALTVVTQLYILLPVSQNLFTFLQGAPSKNIGLLTSLFGIFYAIGLITWGVLSTKIGKERILIIGLLSLSFISFLIPFMKGFDNLLIMRCIQGFFAASFPPIAIAWLAENLNDSLKPKAISLISCAFLLAGTIGQWYGSLTIDESLYDAMWFLAIIYGLGTIPFFFTNLEKKKNNISDSESIESMTLIAVLYQLPRILFNRSLFGIYLCSLFVLLSFVTLYSVLNTQESRLNINISMLRNIGIFAMLFSLTTSYVFKIIKPLQLLGISLFLMSLSLTAHAIYINQQIQSEIIIYVAHFIFVVGIAYAVPSMITNIALLSNEKTRGISTSLYTFILFIGASLGAYLPTYFSSNYLLFFIAICLLLCAIQLIFIKNKRHRG